MSRRPSDVLRFRLGAVALCGAFSFCRGFAAFLGMLAVDTLPVMLLLIYSTWPQTLQDGSTSERALTRPPAKREPESLPARSP